MRFEFTCRALGCHKVVEVIGRVGHSPKVPYHHRRPMRRVYTPLRSSVEWSVADYANMAYDGTEKVPGMSTQEVRQMVDISGRPKS